MVHLTCYMQSYIPSFLFCQAPQFEVIKSEFQEPPGEGGGWPNGETIRVGPTVAVERFNQQEWSSFFRHSLYQGVGTADHFMRQLQGIAPWKPFTKTLVRTCLGKARQGRPSQDPLVVLHMLMVA